MSEPTLAELRGWLTYEAAKWSWVAARARARGYEGEFRQVKCVEALIRLVEAQELNVPTETP